MWNKHFSLNTNLNKLLLLLLFLAPTLAESMTNKRDFSISSTADTSQITRKVHLLKNVKVTASRAPLARNQQARMVTVLGHQQIQSLPVQSINDILKYVAGVDVRQRGPIGAQTDISIRGGYWDEITILLNGVNICDPQSGHNAFDLPVDVSDIERIEVLEGPAARVYGTSSLLGAINIVTRPKAKSGADIRIEGGSYGYAAGGLRANCKTKHWNNQLSGGYSRSDGYTRDKAGNLNMNLKGGRTFYQGSYEDDDIVVDWHAGLSSRRFGEYLFYGASDDQFEQTFKSFAAVKAENKKGFFHFHPLVYWNHSFDRYEWHKGKTKPVPFNYHTCNIYGINLNNFFDWIGGRTAFGADLRNEDIISVLLGEPLKTPQPIHGTDAKYTRGLNRTNVSFFLEHNFLLRHFTLSAGVFTLENSWADMNVRIYPGADASCLLGENWKIYASYNSSMRLPTFTELYYNYPGYIADKHLKAEELSAIEAGVKYRNNGIMATVSYFHNKKTNVIDWLYSQEKKSLLSVNLGEINTDGAEASFIFDFQRLFPSQTVVKSMNIAYCYLNQDKKEENGKVTVSALEYLRHKVVANINLHIWNKLNMAIDYRFQDRLGSYLKDKEPVKYKPYHVIDSRLSWNEHSYSAYLQANNLLNANYHDFGIPGPGVWITAGATCHLSF